VQFRDNTKPRILCRIIWCLGLLACGCQSDGDFLIDTRTLLGLEATAPGAAAPPFTEDPQSRGIRFWQTVDTRALGAHSKQEIGPAGYSDQEQGGVERTSLSQPRIPPWQPRPVAMEKSAAPEAAFSGVVDNPRAAVSQDAPDCQTNQAERPKFLPPYTHWADGPLRLWLWFKCACLRPVCDLCSLEH
jgi:hypothetical protein